MSDFDRNVATARAGYADRAAVDAGLRAHMIRVYNYMAIGVALTGIVAWLTFTAAVDQTGAGLVLTPLGQTLFNGPVMWLLILAPLGMVMVLSFGINRLAAGTAMMLFFLYAALLGLSMATIFLAYTGTSITRVFFISAASFGALSLYGYTTQRDLSPIGSFLMMGVIGLIIASLVSIFLASSALQFAISALGVLIFAGLTAYDTQKLKEMYIYGDYDGEAAAKASILGALTLYLDFINMFQFLLALFGNRNN
jgi:uncharacterized protein